jgi:hypothetical protein
MPAMIHKVRAAEELVRKLSKLRPLRLTEMTEQTIRAGRDGS